VQKHALLIEIQRGEESMPKHYLTRQEAARYLSEHGLPVSKNTLQKFATIGGGPTYRIFGNKSLYTAEALESWAEARLSIPRKSTSEAA
jgi:hypothetical protein